MCWKKISTFKNKKWIFGHYCDFAKITKMAKNPFFILKGGNFFSAHLNHLGRQFFCIFYTFWFDQKNGQNKKKALLRTAHFFWLNQKVQKIQKNCLPKWLRCAEKKSPPFKIKNVFLAIFVILPKSQKWPKIHFLFWKVEIFSGTP